MNKSQLTCFFSNKAVGKLSYYTANETSCFNMVTLVSQKLMRHWVYFGIGS